MSWQLVKVLGWVDDGDGQPPPGGGTGDHPDHTLPPVQGPVDPGYGVPETPVDPGYGVPGGPRPDHGLPQPEPPVDPGYGVPEGGHPDHTLPGDLPHPEHPIVLPPENVGDAHPEHPIFYPPVIWPDPPQGLPSVDPDEIPQHPDLPDLNQGQWGWVTNSDGSLTRAFITDPNTEVQQPVAPKTPPQAQQPGNWVIALTKAGPAWAWVPSKVSDGGGQPPNGGEGGEQPPTDAHPDHTLPGDLPHPDQGLPQPEQPVDPGYGVPETPPEQPVDPNAPHPDQTLPGDLPPDQQPPDPNAPQVNPMPS